MTMIAATTRVRPKLGFLGLGWIGTHRLEAIAGSDRADIAALTDSSPAATARAWSSVPDASVADSFDDLLTRGLDGIVIATPSGLHAEQAIAALESGVAVFCQKPLAANAFDAKRVVDTARAVDRLLAVDLSYRHLSSAQALRRVIQSRELGDIYAVELVFHNAYGPDKSWCRDHALSGGGCLIDLGVHLVDLALWMLEFPAVRSTGGVLFANGSRLETGCARIEDLSHATIELDNGVSMHMTCSWHAHIGQDAIIRAAFFGTQGAAVLENTAGSFYDFTARVNQGATQRQIAADASGWGGRAAIEWVDALSHGSRFDAAVERVVDVAAVLDGIYGR